MRVWRALVYCDAGCSGASDTRDWTRRALRRGALGRRQTAAARRAPLLNKLAWLPSILTFTGATGLGGIFSLFSADGDRGLEEGGAILAPGEMCMLAS